ncbi:DUF5658 family protein [Candidatus Bathyarchaeota archaeon]|nr:DUF5658 family protein [Candidatus Bathyarchaeota archaeon]
MNKRELQVGMLNIKTIPSLSLMTVGTIDWLTTVIGIAYFGAIEANPFMAQLTSTNLLLFTIIKLSTTIMVGLIFYKAEKTLLSTENKESKTFKITHIGLRMTYVGATIALLIAVINNILVVTQAL